MADIHSARHYLLQGVLPAYEALGSTLMDGVTGDRRDIFAVGRAAEACLNLADHLARDPTCEAHIPGAPKSRQYVSSLTERYEHFAITRDIANSIKHHKISRDNKTLDGIESLLERWALIRFKDADGVYWATRKVVIVQLLGGTGLFAEDILFQCINEWITELLRLNQIPSAPRFDRVPQRLLLRKDVPAHPCIEMRAEQGEYFQSQPIVLRYESKLDAYREMRGKVGKVQIKVNMVVAPSRFPNINSANNA